MADQSNDSAGIGAAATANTTAPTSETGAVVAAGTNEPAQTESGGMMTVIVSPAEDHTAPSSPSDAAARAAAASATASAIAPDTNAAPSEARPPSPTVHPSAEQIAAESSSDAGDAANDGGSSGVGAYFAAKRSAQASQAATSHFREQQKLYRAQEVAQDHAALAPHLALCHQCVHATVVFHCADCGGKDYCADCSALVHKFASTRSHTPVPIEGALVLQPGQDTKPPHILPGKNSGGAAPAAAEALDGINEDEGEEEEDTDDEGSGAPRVTFAATASAVSAMKDEEYADDTGASEAEPEGDQPATLTATTTATQGEQQQAQTPAPAPAVTEPPQTNSSPVASAASSVAPADAATVAEASRHEAAATAAAAMASAAIQAAAANAAQIQLQQQQHQQSDTGASAPAAGAPSGASVATAAPAAAPASAPAPAVAAAAPSPSPKASKEKVKEKEKGKDKEKEKEKEKEKSKSNKKAAAAAPASSPAPAPAPAQSPTSASSSSVAPSPSRNKSSKKKKKKASPASAPAPAPAPAQAAASPARPPVPRQKTLHASPSGASKSPTHAHSSSVGGSTAAQNDAAAFAAMRAAQLAEWEAEQRLAAEKLAKDAKDARALKRATAGFPDTRPLGVLEHVFNLLVQEPHGGGGDAKQAPPALAGFRVPYTVVFHNGSPFASLVTDEAGYLRQKHWGQLKAREVVAHFLSPIHGQAAGGGHAGTRPRVEQVVAVSYSMQYGVDAQEINVGQLHSLFGLVAEDELKQGAGGGDAEDEYASEWDRTPSLPRHSSIAPAPASRPTGNFILQRVIRSSPTARSCIMYHVTTSWVDGRAGAEDAPLKPGKSFGRITECSNTQSTLCVKIRTGRPPVQVNVPASDTYEGAVFNTLAAAIQRFVAGTGLGTPIRFSGYCTFAEEEPPPGATVSASARMKWYWCFADLLQLNSVHRGPDGALANTAVANGAADVSEAGTGPANAGTGTGKKKKSVTAPTPLVLNNLDRSCCAKCCRRFRMGSLQNQSGTPIMLRQVLLKWVPTPRFEYPEQLFANTLGVDTDPARADWYKCVVSVCADCLDEIRRLKTIPSRTQLAPWLAAAAAAAGVGAGPPTAAGADEDVPPPLDPLLSLSGGSGVGGGGSKVVLPYLAKAPSMHPDAPGFSGLLSPPEAKRLGPKHVSMAQGLGLGEQFNTAASEGSPGVKRAGSKRAQAQAQAYAEQHHHHGLSSSASAPSLLQGKKHAIAGGQGTAPREPHYPKSRHHRGSPSRGSGASFASGQGGAGSPSSRGAWGEERADGYALSYGSPSPKPKHHKGLSNGALPALGAGGRPSPDRQQQHCGAASPAPLSPFSSGQKRMHILSPAPVHATTAAGAGAGDAASPMQGGSDRERERERERQRERALDRVLQESRRSGELVPYLHQQHSHAGTNPSSASSSDASRALLRNSKSVGSLQPLQGSPTQTSRPNATVAAAAVFAVAPPVATSASGSGSGPASAPRGSVQRAQEEEEEDEYAQDAAALGDHYDMDAEPEAHQHAEAVEEDYAGEF